VVTVASALVGGLLFVLLTGKGTSLDSGAVLTVFVVLATLHATRDVLARTDVPARVRYAAIPLVFLPAVALYSVVFTAVSGLLSELPFATAPTELTAVHGLVAGVFVVAYVAVELGLHERSTRLYVALVNVGRPARETVLTTRREYNEY
jgi:NAD(P)H-quinone oxidoreductase subunit 5